MSVSLPYYAIFFTSGSNFTDDGKHVIQVLSNLSVPLGVGSYWVSDSYWNNLKKMSKLSFKRGVTSIVGSFEIEIPDSTGSLTTPGAFNNISLFNDCFIWIDYDPMPFKAFPLAQTCSVGSLQVILYSGSYVGGAATYFPSGSNVWIVSNVYGEYSACISGSYNSGSYTVVNLKTGFNNSYGPSNYANLYNEEPPFQFGGKVETIKSKLDANEGYVRTITGRDYSEILFRLIQRRGWAAITATGSGGTGSSIIENSGSSGIVSDIVQTCGLTTGPIEFSPDPYNLVMENRAAAKGIKEVSDFDDRDFYVDPSKGFHWFLRQEYTGSQTFAVGTNILEYSVHQDITSVKNRWYIFGYKNGDKLTGSYWPTDGDMWTETGSNTLGNINCNTLWGGYWNSSSIGDVYQPNLYNYMATIGGNAAVGQFYIQFMNWASKPAWPCTGSIICYITGAYVGAAGEPNGNTAWLRQNSMQVQREDYLNFYFSAQSNEWGNAWVTYPRIRLETDSNNYYETYIEDPANGGTDWIHYHIKLGPAAENPSGSTVTGSPGTNTGSYFWTRHGNPDWFRINDIKFLTTAQTTINGNSNTVNTCIDGLGFEVRYQGFAEDTGSQALYGLREETKQADTYVDNQYCQNVANTQLAITAYPVRQIKLSITGSPGLQPGYRYFISLPAENIGSMDNNQGYYELIDIEDIFDRRGYISECTFSDKKNIRTLLPILNWPQYHVQTYTGIAEVFNNINLWWQNFSYSWCHSH